MTVAARQFCPAPDLGSIPEGNLPLLDSQPVGPLLRLIRSIPFGNWDFY